MFEAGPQALQNTLKAVMMSHRLNPTLKIACFMLVLGGCATSMQAWQPGAVKTRGAFEMLQLDGEGQGKEREVIFQTLKKQIGENPYFSLVDFTKSGVFMDFHEEGVWVRNEQLPLTQGPNLLASGRGGLARPNGAGKGGSARRPQYVGIVGITVTLVDNDGRILLDERPYTAEAQVEKEEELDRVRALAAQRVVAQFIEDIQPRVVERPIRFDESLSEHDEAIEYAETGRLKIAGVLLRAQWQQHPENPTCIFNLAVIRDLLGDPEEALFLLDGLPADYRTNEVAEFRNQLRSRASEKSSADSK